MNPEEERRQVERQLDYLADSFHKHEEREALLLRELKEEILTLVREATKNSLSDDQYIWVKLAIQREAQSIRLRQAIIEKTLTGLVWAMIAGAAAASIDWITSGGWLKKP